MIIIFGNCNNVVFFMINPKIDLVKAVPGVVAVKKKKVLTTRIQELSQKWNQLKLPKAVAVVLLMVAPALETTVC